MRFQTLLLPLGMISFSGSFSHTAPDATACQGVVRKTKTNVVVRAAASVTSDSVGFAAAGAVLSVNTCGRGWCEVQSVLFKGFVPESLLAGSGARATPPNVAPAGVKPPAPRTCCKICTRGKACGNSCISRRYTCRKPPGCACNG